MVPGHVSFAPKSWTINLLQLVKTVDIIAVITVITLMGDITKVLQLLSRNAAPMRQHGQLVSCLAEGNDFLPVLPVPAAMFLNLNPAAEAQGPFEDLVAILLADSVPAASAVVGRDLWWVVSSARLCCF